MSRAPTRRDVVKTAVLCTLPAPLLGFPAPARAGGDAVPEDPLAGRSLVFEDGFTRLDPNVWGRGPKATIADSGFYGRAAFAREGGEFGFSPYDIVADPAAEDGSALQIEARYIGRPLGIRNYHGNDDPEYQWISGNIQMATQDAKVLKGWSHGYFEARMWMPRHPLTWPAFWFLNARSLVDRGRAIEIDVVEHKGWEPDVYGTYLHEWGKPGERGDGSGVETGVDVTEGYHRYGVLVEAGAVMPYFDRKPVRSPETGEFVRWTIHRQKEFEAQEDLFWPLLTLALRADVPYPRDLTPEQHSARLKVDYFRVYQ